MQNLKLLIIEMACIKSFFKTLKKILKFLKIKKKIYLVIYQMAKDFFLQNGLIYQCTEAVVPSDNT